MAQDRKIVINLGTEREDMGRKQVAHLTLETSKGHRPRTVASTASVSWHGDGFRTHELFGDFTKTVAAAPGVATQAAIDRLHNATFTPEAIETLKAEVTAFYAKKGTQVGVRAA